MVLELNRLGGHGVSSGCVFVVGGALIAKPALNAIRVVEAFDVIKERGGTGGLVCATAWTSLAGSYRLAESEPGGRHRSGRYAPAMRWSPGAIVEYCHVRHNRVWWRAPARVIEDGDDMVAVWWPAGTVYQRPVHSDRLDALRRLAEDRWELEEQEWWGGDCLLVVPNQKPYALWPYRDPDQNLIAWYGNPQATLQRTERGYATNDWTLDVVASPDLSNWGYKDEDELVEGAQIGLYSAEEVAQIRAAASEIVGLMESRAPVFERWAAWRPDPRWDPPVLP